MKIRAAFIVLILATLSAAGCKSVSTSPDPAHNARNALDWTGAYRGVLPCASCEGIDTVVVLTDDGGYETYEKYLGKEDDATFSAKGQFSWNEAGNTVRLSGSEALHFFVGENQLTRLAQDGSRITGDMAELYVLNKISDSLTEKYWKLVELNGRPIPTLEGREPYMILRNKDERVNGFSGCNGFNGVYKLDEAKANLGFDKIASTLMACMPISMEVEYEFQEVLRNTINYSMRGDELILNGFSAIPLARFEVVYLY